MANTKPKQGGMSVREKGMLAFAVVAILLAGGLVYWTIWQQEPHGEIRVNVAPGSAPKALWMKAHKNGQDSSGSPTSFQDPTDNAKH